MSSPSTRILHPPRVDTSHAQPLTLPIYETSTYVFDSADEVAGLSGGTHRQVPLLALREPDGAERRAHAGVARGRRSGAAVLVGDGGDDDGADGADAGRRRGAVQRRDLRRHAARARGSARRASACTRASSAAQEMRDPTAAFSDRTRLLWFESPINPTLRCVDIRARGGGVPGARGDCRSSTTPSPARSTSSRSRSASIW